MISNAALLLSCRDKEEERGKRDLRLRNRNIRGSHDPGPQRTKRAKTNDPGTDQP